MNRALIGVTDRTASSFLDPEHYGLLPGVLVEFNLEATQQQRCA